MSFQEKTTVSWFGRLKRSVGGVVAGLLLVVGMVVLLFWNEGRAVTTARSLAEGAGLVVAVDAGSVDPARDGSLVHVSGPVEAASNVADAGFGIETAGVRLVRKAEMYQWIETRRTETQTKLGGGEETVTTYTYALGWSDRPQDSSQFRQPDGRTNPPMEVQGETFQLQQASLGAFTLDGQVLGRIGGARPMAVSPDRGEAIQAAVGAGMKATVTDGRIYLGYDPREPRLGDYRIGYDLVPLGPISVVGRQAGSGLAPYQTQAGNALLMVESGIVPAQQMFDDAVSANTVLTWIVRIVGLLFLIFGFSLILGPLGVIGDVIPFVGSIVRLGTGIVATVAGILIGSATIAIAWFYYRPFTALVILAVGGAAAFAITWLGRRRKAAPAAAQEPAMGA